MERLLALLLCILLLCGCAAPAIQPEPALPPAAVPAPAVTLAPLASPAPSPAAFPEPTFFPVPVQERAVKLEAANYIEPWVPDYAADIIATYNGTGEGLFQAICLSLAEREWDTLEQGISHFYKYLPAGEEAEVRIKAPNAYWGEYDLKYKTADILPIKIYRREELGLIYVDVYVGGYTDTIRVLFDRRADGAYLPVKALEFQRDAWDQHRFERFGDVRWMVYGHPWATGSGIYTARVDWYNIEDGRVDIFYYDHVGELSAPSTPLGWWHFKWRSGGAGNPL